MLAGERGRWRLGDPLFRMSVHLVTTSSCPDLSPDDWRRICDALRYLGRDLHHRSFAVSPERRELLWQEMDQCWTLADRLADRLGHAGQRSTLAGPEPSGSLD